jgi:broad specificity phosphatase PhoE
MDPGLDKVGREQAAVAARALAPLGPCPLYTSPLRRTRETAAPLEAVWATRAVVEPAVGEIVSPTSDLAERAAWLGEVMSSRWDQLGPDLLRWREGVIGALLAVAPTAPLSVIVTHFIAINVAVGEATGDRRVMCFAPDNCSRTVLDVSGGKLQVVERGGEAVTAVQ